MPRSISVQLQTNLELDETNNFYLMELHFPDGIKYLSSSGDRQLEGKVFIETGLVSDIQMEESSNGIMNGVVVLSNHANEFSFLRNNPSAVKNKKAKIWFGSGKDYVVDDISHLWFDGVFFQVSSVDDVAAEFQVITEGAIYGNFLTFTYQRPWFNHMIRKGDTIRLIEGTYVAE